MPLGLLGISLGKSKNSVSTVHFLISRRGAYHNLSALAILCGHVCLNLLALCPEGIDRGSRIVAVSSKILKVLGTVGGLFLLLGELVLVLLQLSLRLFEFEFKVVKFLCVLCVCVCVCVRVCVGGVMTGKLRGTNCFFGALPIPTLFP